MQFIGRLSLALATSVHVCDVGSHCTAAISADVSAARSPLHIAFHPLPAMFGWAPAPDKGGLACVACPASTNFRNRPTVTSYASSRKSPTVAPWLALGYIPSPDTS